jgi:general secretion pathway protein I
MRSTARAARDMRGFTLLEVVVAMAVLAIAFTAMLGLHVRSLNLVARERAYTRALLLARTLVTETELGALPEIGSSNGDFEERQPGRWAGFTWEREVVDTPIPDTREIRIRVVPRDQPGAVAQLVFFQRRGGS